MTPDSSRTLPSAVGRLDGWLNRIFSSRCNPAYQSGTLVVVLWLVLLITGLWLLLEYRIAAPWASVARITEDPWVGNWMRGVHRYASDLAVIATLFHALRIFLQRRTWGPRTLAWTSGLVLFGLVLVSGWTGFVMVWDSFGHRLAVEGARLIDVLPVLSEPIQLGFTGDRPVAHAFFFLNLFLHVAIPLGLGLVFWLHVSRLARPLLLPPRQLAWGLVGLLLLVALLLPIGMAPEADPFQTPAVIPLDWFYAFWLPAAAGSSPLLSWAALLLAATALLLVPRWTRPAPDRRPGPSRVDSHLCTGCTHCSLDCPFEAITMVPRADGRADLIAQIDPARCVGCGICAGSCAPMGIGPPGLTGRDQLAGMRQLGTGDALVDRIIAFACQRGAARTRPTLEGLGVVVVPIACVGNLHTSTIEFAVRAGARCAVVLSCPPRDCWNREGPRWLDQRVYADREAELKPRVDRRRVRILELATGEPAEVRALITRLNDELGRLERPAAEPAIALEELCEAAHAAEEASR